MRDKLKEILRSHICQGIHCTCDETTDQISKLITDDLRALAAEFGRVPFSSESLSEFFRGQEQAHRDVETAIQRHAATWERS